MSNNINEQNNNNLNQIPSIQPEIQQVPAMEPVVEQPQVVEAPGMNVVAQSEIQQVPVMEPVVEQPQVVEAPGMNVVAQPEMQQVPVMEPVVEQPQVVEAPGMNVVVQPEIQQVIVMEPVVEQPQVVEAPGMNTVTPTIEAPGSSTVVSVPAKKSNNKKLIMIVLFILIAAIIGGVVFFLMSDDKKENQPTNQPNQPISTEPVEEKKDWDPSTSKIKMSSSATKLTCTYEELFNGMTNKITYTHLYEDGVYTQVVVEDEIIFNDDTIQYYDYYVGSALEEVEYETEMYDNITIEVREKKTSMSLAYSFDLTASTENPKNFVKDKDLTIEEMTSQMLNLGFKCE